MKHQQHFENNPYKKWMLQQNSGKKQAEEWRRGQAEAWKFYTARQVCGHYPDGKALKMFHTEAQSDGICVFQRSFWRSRSKEWQS